MTWTPRRERLRALLSTGQCLYPAAIFDPASARIAEDIGFESLILPGSTVALTVLGAPDIGLLTSTELAEQTHRVSRACSLPMFVDADHGYGNALNVRRTITELEHAGASGIVLLDTDWPPNHGNAKRSQLLSVDEGIGKMRAAVDAREDSSMVIVGRTDAGAITDFEDALIRAKAYQETGVDAMFLYGVETREQVERLGAELHVPWVLGGGKASQEDPAWLASHGVRVITQGSLPILAALKGIQTTLQALRDHVPTRDISGLASNDLVKSVLRQNDYERWMRDYL